MHDKIAQRAAGNNQSQHFNAGLLDILQVQANVPGLFLWYVLGN